MKLSRAIVALPRILLEEIWQMVKHVILQLPGRSGRILRGTHFAMSVSRCGARPVLGQGVEVTGGSSMEIGDNFVLNRHGELHSERGRLRIGNNVAIGANSCIASSDGGSIVIKDDVIIAQNVVVRAADHSHKRLDVAIRYQGHEGGEIVIGEGVWIGANAAVMRNVHIGAHSIVAAGAVVTRDVEPFSIVGGVPARLLRKRTAGELPERPGGSDTDAPRMREYGISKGNK